MFYNYYIYINMLLHQKHFIQNNISMQILDYINFHKQIILYIYY